jgi:hypothetical protein
MTRDGSRDVSGDLLPVGSRVTRSPDVRARVPCFSGSRAGLVAGFTCGTFVLELWKLDVVDCVHDSWCVVLTSMEIDRTIVEI